MKLLSSLLSAIIRVLFYIAVLSGVVMAGMILLSAILRYVINEPLSFSDELAGLLFVTLGFFSFPYVMEKSEHINLAVLVERLSPAKQKSLSVSRIDDFLFFFNHLYLPILEFRGFFSSIIFANRCCAFIAVAVDGSDAHFHDTLRLS